MSSGESLRVPEDHSHLSREVGNLLDLGIALGHRRFEVMSLAGREVGTVAVHAGEDEMDTPGYSANSAISTEFPTKRARRKRGGMIPETAQNCDLRREVSREGMSEVKAQELRGTGVTVNFLPPSLASKSIEIILWK